MTTIAFSHVNAAVEESDREVVEVVVRWGGTVLQTLHLETHETLRVGEGTAVVIPGLAPTTIVERGMVRIPEGATVVSGSVGVGERTVLELATLHVEIGRTRAAKALPRTSVAQSLKKSILGVLGASMFAHVATVAALAMAPGASLDDENASLDRDTAARFLAINEKTFTRELESSQESGTHSGGESGGAAKGPSGLAGTPSAKSANNAYAIPKTTAEERLGLVKRQIEAGDYAALGALTRVFGASATIDGLSFDDDPSGHDALAAAGHIAGPQVGAAFGMNGLGLASYGPGGGGISDGLGTGMFGGFGHLPGEGGPNGGWCNGGDCSGTHVNSAKHKTQAVKVIEPGDVPVTGSLPKEVVRRIVRANYPSIRACYEAGLKKDPGLHGTVSTRFVIDQTGAVEVATSTGEPSISGCVQRVFSSMSFPAPENGKALVVYPIEFAQE